MTTTTTSTHGEKVFLPEREKEICVVIFIFSSKIQFASA
jgi:hypothetical protein